MKSLNVFILQTKLCLYCSAWNMRCCTGTAGTIPNTQTGSPFLWAERSFINFTVFCNQWVVVFLFCYPGHLWKSFSQRLISALSIRQLFFYRLIGPLFSWLFGLWNVGLHSMVKNKIYINWEKAITLKWSQAEPDWINISTTDHYLYGLINSCNNGKNGLSACPYKMMADPLFYELTFISIGTTPV